MRVCVVHLSVRVCTPQPLHAEAKAELWVSLYIIALRQDLSLN